MLVQGLQATRAGSNCPALWASIYQILPFVSTAVKRSHECSIDVRMIHSPFSWSMSFHVCIWSCVFMSDNGSSWKVDVQDSLPVFDRTFAEAIAQSPLVNPTFVIALATESAGEFTSIVSRICESFDTKVSDVLCSETDKLEQFWSLIIASEKLFLEASTQQLGFGLCETRARSEGNFPYDELRKEALIKALVSKPTNKRLKPDPVQPSFFFFACAVRARSSDGHQSIGLDCPFPRMKIMWNET